MIPRTVLVHSKPLMPVLMGLCIGIALSLILVPLLEEQCHLTAPHDTGQAQQHQAQQPQQAPNTHRRSTKRKNMPYRRTKSFPSEDQSNLDYWNSEIFEPRRKIVEAPAGNNAQNLNSKILRPRYISTELGIREKLFVGVLTSKNTLDTFGVAINKTLNQAVPKLVFFMNSRGTNLPTGMSMVIFSDEKPHLMPFHMFKYISDHYVKAYDWFYFIHDSTYVKGDKLFDLVQHTSAVHSTILGRPVPGSNKDDESKPYCDVGSGILISQSVMSKVVQHLDWCIKNAYPTHQDTDNIGHCLHFSTKLSCTNVFYGNTPKNYTSFFSADFDFQEDINELNVQEEFLNALTVHRIHSDMDIYRLHRFYSERELEKARLSLEEIKKQILEVSPKTPTGNKSLTWPIGVDPPSVPRTRFDVLVWQYFTETHIYLDSDFSNSKPLKGVDKEDVQDVIRVSVDRLNQRHNHRYSYKSLINGYRKFDATRGMDYILDLSLYDRDLRSEVTKRVYLTRPLGAVEIVPMPYVTENTRVNLVLPVTTEDRDSVMSMLDSYAHTCLESGDNTHLFVVFVYKDSTEAAQENDIYSVLKSMITFYENKYQQGGAKITWTAIHSSMPSHYTIMDAVSRKFPPESLLLLCTVGMDLSIEFLNRVRMNTIAGWQAFFPIGFWQYKPNLVYTEKPYPTAIEIKRGLGHYDKYSYVHASFYNSDYQSARRQMISLSGTSDPELYDMFLKYHTLHLLRAVEPSLKLHFMLRGECGGQGEAYNQCQRGRGESLASRQQLAMLVFEYQQKLDQMQLNVMHQQHGQNVEQMKPDMLRK